MGTQVVDSGCVIQPSRRAYLREHYASLFDSTCVNSPLLTGEHTASPVSRTTEYVLQLDLVLCAIALAMAE